MHSKRVEIKRRKRSNFLKEGKKALTMLLNSAEATWLFDNDCSKAVRLLWFCMLVSVSVVFPPFLFADTISSFTLCMPMPVLYAAISDSTTLLRG